VREPKLETYLPCSVNEEMMVFGRTSWQMLCRGFEFFILKT